MHKSQSNGSKGQEQLGISVAREVREGLRSLLAAHRQAQAHGVDTWQFAVEMEELRRAGLTCTDLRALVLDGIVTPARERTKRSGPRTFVKEGPLTFVAESCFRLTSTGATIVAHHVNHCEKPQGPHFPLASPEQLDLKSCVPHWDKP